MLSPVAQIRSTVRANILKVCRRSLSSEKPSGSAFPWEIEESDQDETVTGLPWDKPYSAPEPYQKPRDNNETAVDPTKSELILGPIQKKKKHTLTSSSQFPSSSVLKELLNFKHEIKDEEMVNSIEIFKPEANLVSQSQLMELAKSLDRMCNKTHLYDYIKSKDTLVASKINSSSTKKTLIHVIISKLWNVSVDDSNNLLSLAAKTSKPVTCTIDLTNKRDVFLLSSSRGVLFDHWSLMGAKLSINAATKELIVTGSQNIVDFVQTSWNQMLNGVVSRKIKLPFDGPSIEGEKLINDLQNTTGAYFELYDEKKNIYVVSAINQRIFKSVNAEFVKLANFQDQSDITIVEASSELPEKFVLSQIDKTLPWYVQTEELQNSYINKQRVSKSNVEFDDNDCVNLSKEVQDLKLEVNKATEMFEYNFLDSQEQKVDRAKELDTMLGIVHSEPFDDTTPSIEIDSKRIEQDIAPINSFEFTEENLITLPLVTSAKFGHILSSEKSKLKYFDSRVDAITRKVSNLPLFCEAKSIIGEAGTLRTHFTNHISVKLSPDFHLEDKLPNVELVINLKSPNVALQSFEQERLWDLFLVESDRSALIPQCQYDINIMQSKNSLLVYNLDDCVNNQADYNKLKEIMEQKEENMALFNKSSIQKALSMINRKSFDIRKSNDIEDLFSSINSKYFPLALPIKNTVKVEEKEAKKAKKKAKSEVSKIQSYRYKVTDVELVRTIELKFASNPIVYEIRDNTHKSNVNVSLIKEDNQPFDEFVQKSIEFAQYLSK